MTDELVTLLKDDGEIVTVKKGTDEVQVRQTQALEVIGKSLSQITEFVSGGGLANLMSMHLRGQAVQQMLGGLTTHSGRDGLDARTIEQNALEIVSQVEAVFKKYQETLASKDKVDPDIHDGEDEFKKWADKQRT